MTQQYSFQIDSIVQLFDNLSANDKEGRIIGQMLRNFYSSLIGLYQLEIWRL